MTKQVKKVKSVKAWGIKNPEGELYPNTWPAERYAEYFINGNKGFKIVRVLITEVK